MSLPKVADTKPIAMELDPGDYWWCACGLSSNQPMCDGAHKGSGFAPTKLTLTEKKRVFLCQCKHSNNKPFCDGSHSELPAADAS